MTVHIRRRTTARTILALALGLLAGFSTVAAGVTVPAGGSSTLPTTDVCTTACMTLLDCDGLLACKDGVCSACAADGDCGAGYQCEAGQCHVGPDPQYPTCVTIGPSCDNGPLYVSCTEACGHGCGIGSPPEGPGACEALPPGEAFACYGGSCPTDGEPCSADDDCPAEFACACGHCIDTEVYTPDMSPSSEACQ